MSFVKIKKSQLNQLIESLLLEQELVYKDDPNNSGYEYGYDKDSKDIFITKSPKRPTTSRQKPTAVKKDSNAYKAIKKFFEDEPKKGKPVADDKELNKPFINIGSTHDLINAAFTDIVNLEDPNIVKLTSKMSGGDGGIKDVVTQITQQGKFKFGYTINNVGDKIVRGVGSVTAPTNKPLTVNPAYVAPRAKSVNQLIKKAYMLMASGYRNLDVDSFMRLTEVSDDIIDIYINMAQRNLNSMKSGRKRQQRKNKDEISLMEQLIKALESYKKEISDYLKTEIQAIGNSFQQISKADREERAIELLKMQGLSMNIT